MVTLYVFPWLAISGTQRKSFSLIVFIKAETGTGEKDSKQCETSHIEILVTSKQTLTSNPTSFHIKERQHVYHNTV